MPCIMNIEYIKILLMIWTTLEGEGSCLMAVNIAPPANQVPLISMLDT